MTTTVERFVWLGGKASERTRHVTFKGTVSTTARLPNEGEIGDAYWVTETDTLFVFDRATYESEGDRPDWFYDPRRDQRQQLMAAAPLAAPSGAPVFCSPGEVVALIGREGESALLAQAAEIIEVVSATVNEWYGPWGKQDGYETTVRGTTSSQLWPGVIFKTVTSIRQSVHGNEAVTLPVEQYSAHGACIFRNYGSWGGPSHVYTITGDVDNEPSPAVKAVVRSLCARALLNPAANTSESVEGTSIVATVGMTLWESRVMGRWRSTSTWPRGNP